MAKPRSEFTRLSRPRSGLGTYSSLWRGSDYLLVVSSTGFNESYRRFYFKDIKGFIVTESKRYFYYNVGSAILLMLFSLPLVGKLASGMPLGLALGETIPMMFFVIPAFLVLVVNLIKGPSCNVAIATGLQTPELRPVGRKRAWRKILAKIDGPIREAQANLVTISPSAPAESSGSPSM